MTDTMSFREKSWREESGVIHHRLALGGGFAAALALAVTLSLGTPGATHAETGIKMQASEVAKLQSVDQGEGAEIVVQGQSAQEKNALIPTSNLARVQMGSFAGIKLGSGQYDNALKCLTQAVYYEAANEPLQGRRAVAQVVLNRMKHPAYPNSVCGVVYEGVNRPVCQFSFTCDGSLLRRPMASKWNEAREVAKAALAGTVEPSVGSATHYHADYVVPRWAFTLAKINKIGAHIFYRFPGRAGGSNAFAAHWNGREYIPDISEARLRAMMEAHTDFVPIEPVYVPGTTVVPHVTDRHAPADVGGRLDTTKTWRLSIPDPVSAGGSYMSAREQQGEAVVAEKAAAVDAGAGEQK